MIKKPAAFILSFTLIISAYILAFAGELSLSDERRDILNNISELLPRDPESPELSAYIDDIMASIIYEDMDEFEMVKSCFDYVKANTSYGSHMAYLDAEIEGTTCSAIYSKYGEVEGFGAVALAANVGMCNAYASAFIMMARKIGYDAYLVKGSTKSGGGGYAYHEWCEINIDGLIYVFDPQLDQSLTKSGLNEYMVFCVTYDQIPGRFIKN